MNKIEVFENKILKLKNILINEIDLENQDFLQINTEIEK